MTSFRTLFFRDIEEPKLVVWFGGMQNLSYADQVKTLAMLSDTMKGKCCIKQTHISSKEI